MKLWEAEQQKLLGTGTFTNPSRQCQSELRNAKTRILICFSLSYQKSDYGVLGTKVLEYHLACDTPIGSVKGAGGPVSVVQLRV